MAEEEAAGHGLKETFSHKLGPLPVGVWVLLVIGVWYVVKKRQGSQVSGGAQTDPAGNVGTIDPRTGYVYGSSQDQSALGGINAGDSGSGSSGSSGSTVAGQYTTNADWARAAINLLVGQGIDPTEANSAIEQFIASQPLSTQQQADVNLAIQALGAPPDPPQPGTNPSPIVTPPSPGPVYATNPPTGLAVTGTTTTAISAKWNRSTNATGYTMTAEPTSAARILVSGQPDNGGPVSTTISGTDASGTISGLQSNTTYTLKVQAQPARPGDGYASVTATTARRQIGGGNPPQQGHPVPAPTPAPSGPQYTTVTVVKFQGNPPPWNSTLWGIAQHYHTSVSELMRLNPQVTNENLIYPGQQIKVPTS
jgi:LysM repeat protein